MEINRQVEDFIKSLLACLQVGKIYTRQHPRFEEYISKSYEGLSAIFQDREEVVVGIVEDEFVFEQEIFFDLSKKARAMIDYLKTREVERLAFYRQVSKDEIVAFVEFLLMPPEDKSISADKYILMKGIKHIVMGKIKVSVDKAKEITQSVDYLSHYNDSMDNIAKSFGMVLDSQSVDALELKFTIASIMENLVGRYLEFFKLAVVKEYDVSTFTHVLNVSILSMHFASRLGFSKDDCIEIGIAALFHDIGKVYVSRKIIKKTDKLTDVEFSAVKSHTVLGAEILLNYVETLGILPVVVAFEHHLKYNLQGYPKVPFLRPLHMASLIVTICDVYDALTQRRSYKRDYPPEVIYEIMLRERGALFDPDLFDKFFLVMGVWPVGTIVRLTDQSIAIVRREGTTSIFTPVVEIVYPQKLADMVDIATAKIRVEKALNPLVEGKDFVAMV
jgi:putative nucleotidyltransferase with HDIG domain